MATKNEDRLARPATELMNAFQAGLAPLLAEAQDLWDLDFDVLDLTGCRQSSPARMRRTAMRLRSGKVGLRSADLDPNDVALRLERVARWFEMMEALLALITKTSAELGKLLGAADAEMELMAVDTFLEAKQRARQPRSRLAEPVQNLRRELRLHQRRGKART